MDSNFSDIIADKFSKKFTAAYSRLSGNGKAKVLKYGSVIFKRWYYSALINETTLSPSFIYGASLGVNNGLSAPSLRPEASGARLKGFSVKENKYSIHEHPVVSDLKILIEFCVPDVELDERGHISGPSAEKISKFLSLSDPYYMEYLTEIAFALKLLKKTDAIYSYKAAIANNYTLFKRLNQEEALKKIVDATVKICSKNINSALPNPIAFAAEKGIVKLIKNPISIDEIYKRIFNSFGVDIERLWDEYNEKSVEDEQSDVLSSTFFLGVILDKWFITPFGEYLKLIEPIYCFCYNFDDELGYLLNVIKSNGNIDTALFSPCAFYSFTPFGRKFFASDKTREQRKAPAIPVSQLLSLLNTDSAPKQRIDEKIETAKEIYSFKIKLIEDKLRWIHVDAAEYNTLHELHIEIALNFSFGFSGYSIFSDESMNPFCEFTDPKSRGSKRKANKVFIEKLDLIKGRKLIYISDTGKKLEIELIKRVPAERQAYFPQTVKLSKHMRPEMWEPVT